VATTGPAQVPLPDARETLHIEVLLDVVTNTVPVAEDGYRDTVNWTSCDTETVTLFGETLLIERLDDCPRMLTLTEALLEEYCVEPE
jgi:hypothetical protein